MKKLLLATAAVLGLAAAPGIAQADYMGNVFRATMAQAEDATPASVAAAGAAIANFLITNDNLTFNSGGATTETIAQFLTSGGVSCAGVGCGQDMQNTLWDFKGTATVAMNQMFSFMHDDGITLTIAGQPGPGALVINAPGATPQITSTGTYTGPSADPMVELVYGECCGVPAVLIGSLPTEKVPEPATLALLGSALLGFGALRRRRRTS